MKTTKRFASIALRMSGVLLCVPIGTGCGSVVMHYYTLAPAVTEMGTKLEHVKILVGPVSVPDAVDRPQFVLQVTPNRVEIDEAHRWAAPLDEGIANAVAGNLKRLLDTRDVGVGPLPGFEATHRVAIDVQRFDSVPGKSVAVDALWKVTSDHGFRAGRTEVEEAGVGADFETIAAAHGRALEKVSREIAAAIRELGSRKAPKKK